jgi:putative oxidoreductase
VRRLYSTFAQGPPGLGLLLLRLLAGIAGIVLGLNALRSSSGLVPTLFHVLWLGLSSLLIVGLWTPIVGTLLALNALWHALTHVEDRWYCVVVGALGVALALLGPGLWSVDAHLFGWRRLEISARKRPDRPD